MPAEVIIWAKQSVSLLAGTSLQNRGVGVRRGSDWPKTPEGRQRCAEAKTIHGNETRKVRSYWAQAMRRLRALEELGHALGIFYLWKFPWKQWRTSWPTVSWSVFFAVMMVQTLVLFTAGSQKEHASIFFPMSNLGNPPLPRLLLSLSHASKTLSTSTCIHMISLLLTKLDSVENFSLACTVQANIKKMNSDLFIHAFFCNENYYY